jgi:hypothetical protein
MKDDDLLGYRCPTCKTINPKHVKYCVHCGHWLLDDTFKAEPIYRDTYLKQIRSYTTKKKRFSFKTFLIGAGILFGLLLLIGSLTSHSPTTSPVATIPLEEFKATAVDLPYDELARNTEKYKGTRVHCVGDVVQVIENPPVLRINVAKQKPDKIILNPEIVWVTRKDSAGRVLENDTVEIWGTVKGPRTYQTILGQSMTVPEIESHYLVVTKKAGDK